MTDHVSDDESNDFKAAIDYLEDLLKNEEADVRKEGDVVIYELHPKKYRQFEISYGKVTSLTKNIVNKYFVEKQKRIYRQISKGELPDPTKSPQAEANRTSERLVVRISPDHVSMFNDIAKLFPTKRAALERAIELLSSAVDLENKTDSENDATIS